ncbi:phosphoglycerate dehydrogenase [Mycolicibacterium sp. 018/SC-01/001]|uniref:phosphoglycerate dehydrogenase n=1 Tax=Mycolicibacterium sp. 018/SC-01/001 TaxID=2592069 RepID=UPI001C8F69A5|nr:phosphoglycerate dehydrogenase [Mycolicibacterium sp. 018/SC-01/001]
MLRDAGCTTRHAPLTGSRSEEELVELLTGVDAVIAASDPFTASVLAAAPALRVIARTGVGFDAIDVDAATERGIVVCNAPGVNRQSVAELTLAFLLMCARHINPVVTDVRSGGWGRPSGTELAGTTLGVIGLGAIGRAVAQLATAFGMRVLAHDKLIDNVYADQHGIEAVPLEQLLSSSDFVSLHLFLGPETHHLINAERLAMMKPTAYLINTSRGPIVDEAALVEALRTNVIAGAALDVVEQEPLAPDAAIRTLPNVVLTPHIGGSTRQARDRSGLIAAHSVIKVLRGELPDNAVNEPRAMGYQRV